MDCYNSCVVNAPTDDVWATLRNFHDFGWAKEVLETCEKIGSEGPHEAGAGRLLNGTFGETLLELDDEGKTLRYSIDDAPGTPVAAAADYVGTVRVRPITSDGTSFVEWSSCWSKSEGGVAEFCDPIYQALLAALQSRFK
jgi:hypothetical protein